MSYLEYADWRDAVGDERWTWRNFTPQEMACRATGRLKVGMTFMNRLQGMRNSYGLPISIISGYRTPAHNAEVTSSRSMSGAHTYGRAADIGLNGLHVDVPLILSFAWTYGFTRCGLKLSRDRFKLHLDDMTAAEGFAVRTDGRGLFCWTY